MTLETQFPAYADDYASECDQWTEAIARLREAQRELRDVEFEVQSFEIEAALDEGIANGKNAEQREALKLALLRDNVDWMQLWVEAEELKATIARAQDEAAAAKDGMALAKRRMDYEIAMLRFMASEGGESNDS